MSARIIDIIAQRNQLDPERLYHLSMSADSKYKKYTISKLDGGERTIYHPSRELKFIQRWLSKKVFYKFPIHRKAFAYTKDNNIATHAGLHTNSNYVLRIDFKDFFPSLKSECVESILRQFQYKDGTRFVENEIKFITRIVTRKGSLPIGAPSSPIISNALMYNFDCHWDSYCRSNEIIYSRYADDLYFSTNRPDVLSRVHKEFELFLRDYRELQLRVNEEKVVHTSKKHRRIVTGLYLTSDGNVSLGRDKKRKIKSYIFSYINGELNQDEINYLRGFLSYANSVEPSFIVSLRAKYDADRIDTLMQGIQT